MTNANCSMWLSASNACSPLPEPEMSQMHSGDIQKVLLLLQVRC